MVEHPGVGQEDVEQPGTLAELQGVPALVAQERAHVDREVLLVGEGGEEGKAEPVVICLLIQIRGEAVVGPEVVADSVLGLVVCCGHILYNPPLSLTPRSPVLLVKVWVGFILLLLAKKVELFICIKIPESMIFGMYKATD